MVKMDKRCNIRILQNSKSVAEENRELGNVPEVSQKETCEVRVELPIASISRLAQVAAAEGVPMEQLVAREVARLVE